SSRIRCALTCLRQSRLDRVSVDAPVLQVELVRPLRDLVDRLARHEPQCLALAAAAVLLARPLVGERRIRRDPRPGMGEPLPHPFLSEYLEDHAASTVS